MERLVRIVLLVLLLNTVLLGFAVWYGSRTFSTVEGVGAQLDSNPDQALALVAKGGRGGKGGKPPGPKPGPGGVDPGKKGKPDPKPIGEKDWPDVDCGAGCERDWSRCDDGCATAMFPAGCICRCVNTRNKCNAVCDGKGFYLEHQCPVE